MYSQEDRLRAVQLYFDLNNNAALTIKIRYSKYSDEQKAYAVHYYMERCPKESCRNTKKDQSISLVMLSNHDKAIVIDALRSRYQLKDLLNILNMAKRSYCYREVSMRKPDKYTELRINIRKVFEESSQRYGYRRIHALLTMDGKTISEKVVRRIMIEEGLEVYHKFRRKYNSYKGEISPEVDK